MFRQLLISALLTSTALADTWTVDDDGKADFNNIQAAVNAASNGDEIIVMPGTYTSTSEEVVNMLGKAVTLRSNDPSNQEVIKATIIDGENTRRGILCINAETNKTIIEGLSIINGYERRENYSAGLTCHGSSPKINKCRFLNNVGFRGAAAHCLDGNPQFAECHFENNHTSAINEEGWNGAYGGACMIRGNVKFEYSTFINNSSEGAAGAILSYKSFDLSSPQTIELNTCIFENNIIKSSDSSFGDGGALAILDMNLQILNSNFSSNETEPSNNIQFSRGGAIYIQWNSNVYYQAYINNTTFDNNINIQFDDDYWFTGGAIHIYSSSTGTNGMVEIIDSSFFNNESNNAGAISTSPYSLVNLIFERNIFCENNPNNFNTDLIWTSEEPNIFSEICNEADCNNNGIGDWEEILSGAIIDCNSNGIPDFCDISEGYSFDCDQNGIPDDCQSDCDDDGFIDACDSEADIDGDGIPDQCEVDCNQNNIPDDYEIELGIAQDCNNNLIPDGCDLVNEPELDCNNNDQFDYCEIAEGTIDDCNANGVIDLCEINNYPPLDCNANLILDVCELTDNDCDENEIVDECELADNDCNQNGIVDACDLENPDFDQNNNGLIDSCECSLGDANNDGEVSINDILVIIGYWGSSISQGDLNFDGIVDITDLLIVVGNWGPCE